MRPPDAEQEEKVISGWKEIAVAMGTCVNKARQLAERNLDPLPVWDYCGTPIAYPTALRDWRGRQKIAWNKASMVARRRLGMTPGDTERAASSQNAGT